MPLPIILYLRKYFIWKVLHENRFHSLQHWIGPLSRNDTFLKKYFFKIQKLLKKQQFMTCYSLLQFIILKISINTVVECKISIRTISTIFFPVRVPVWRLTKSGDLYLSFFKKYFLVLNRLKKPKRSEQHKVIY